MNNQAQIKQRAVTEFVARCAHLPAQGTPEWLAIRGIGGSELHLLLTNERALVASKIGLTTVPDMLSMRWGTLMEDTLRDAIAGALRCSILETSSVPSAEVVGKTYSMDGIGVVRYLVRDEAGAERFVWLTTLFEFKCPYTREIVHGEMPRAYVPQVKSGMSDLALPEIALFAEGVLRVSRFSELAATPHIETWLHRAGNPAALCPMLWGFIGFAVPGDQVMPPEAAEWARAGFTDFARTNYQTVDALFTLSKHRQLVRWQSRTSRSAREWARCSWWRTQRIPVRDERYNMDSELVRFYRECSERGWRPLGVLGFKLIDLNVLTVEKTMGYTLQYETEITRANVRIRELNAIACMNARDARWREMYDVPSDTAAFAGL